MIKILNICLHQNSIFIKFFKILKIHEIFCENPRIIFVLLYDVHKENMFTINLEDGREAPSKASLSNLINILVEIYQNISNVTFKQCLRPSSNLKLSTLDIEMKRLRLTILLTKVV